MRRFICLLALLTAGATTAPADGSMVRLERLCGPLRIVLFTSPSPLRTGPADFSLLIENGSTHGAVLGGSARLSLSRPRQADIETELRAGAGQNKLLYEGVPIFPAPGPWRAMLQVTASGQRCDFAMDINVLSRDTSIRAYWLYLAPVPCLVALFILNQLLKSRLAMHARDAPAAKRR